jgi:protein-L-isoaspartate(D-aspartate) O-methyltransferase
VKDFAQPREMMLARHIAGRGVRSPQVLAAMREVAREDFVPPSLRDDAYVDAPLPIPQGQTISQPYIVACMIEAAGVKPGDRVLEIGTGSGYAAAVLSRIAYSVHTVERHPELAESAATRLADLGYHNVVVHIGDGTRGLPDAAPFDAIIVTAGGPRVPAELRAQLAAGGRLVMPVGGTPRRQRLCRVTRDERGGFREEALEEVMFVPLIGEHGWKEEEDDAPGRAPAPPPAPPDVPALIRAAAEPLPGFDDPAFGAMFDRFGDCRVVLLGEASHGTSEFYQARAAITRRLIEEHGFNIVAVEADWPDAAMVDRYVRHRPAQHGSTPPFRRFPSWMWRNTDVEAFTEWLRSYNEQFHPAGRVGFYGLDLYSLSASISAVLGYLGEIDPEAAQLARERYGCLVPWQHDPAQYGRPALHPRFAHCEAAVLAQLRDLLEKRLEYTEHDGESFLDATQNARLVASAERYYRLMYQGSAKSWNLRDTHMFETLVHLLDARGPDAKAVVWAHNSHIGNAGATEMGQDHDELNIGQLCRARFGADAALIGLSTHTGTVAAATHWDGDMEVKRVAPSRPDSYEHLAHASGVPRFLLDLTPGANPALHRQLRHPRLERFIGVIYRPETELQSHYARATLPDQFDAFVWFDETRAVTPLSGITLHGTPDTYPFGL